MPIAEQLITEHLDTWSSTIKAKSSAGRGGGKKQELYGIKKLRGLILELAVRGLLVPQDSNDKSAKNDLELFIKNRDSSKLKITKVDDTTEAAEIDIPKSWLSVSLGEVVSIRTGFAFKSKDYADRGTFILRVTNINADGSFDTSNSAFLADTDLNDKMQGFQLEEGELLVVMVGGSLGKIGQVTSDILPALLNQNMWRLKPYSVQMNLRFLRFVLYDLNENRLQITKSTHGHLAMGTYAAAKVPFPPLAEQHRIVAKVDELMALCDQLEQQQTDSIAAHETLVTALLGALTSLSKQGQFESAWQRIAANFDSLFTTERSIDQLKQTILQLAVMGKLVPQDPSDEPASELLKKIATEKAKLIKEKKIKKQKMLPKITDQETSDKLPPTWEWERLQHFSIIGTGATPSRDQLDYYNPPEFNWVTSGETSKEYIYETKEQVSKKAIEETNVSIYPVGTLMVAMYGQGKTRGQITELAVDAGSNQACAAIQLVQSSKEHREYIKLFFKKAYEELRSFAAGGAQPNLNVGKISNTVVPIPPLAEQHRIVAKVDELMSLCDALKAKLKAAQSIQLKLADTLVEQAIG